jgi:hypothetical protein
LDLGVLGTHNFSVTNYYTDLAPLTGIGKDIGEYQATSNLTLDSQGALSLQLTYRNGRREDTGARDESMTLGLSGKY